MNQRFETVDPRSPVAQRPVQAYFAELEDRFPTGFDGADQSRTDAELLSPPRGAFVVALGAERPVACGGVQTIGDRIGEVKRMWVDPACRGAGLGSRLLRHLESIAADLGHEVVRLDTHGALVEAIAMYERAGYLPIERYNDNPYAAHFFEKRLRSPAGGLDLGASSPRC